MKGKILMFNKTDGFGFIIGENGTKYYTKLEGLSPEEKAKVEKNMSVSFELKETIRGKEAFNLRLI